MMVCMSLMFCSKLDSGEKTVAQPRGGRTRRVLVALMLTTNRLDAGLG
jgi:hypothetical protein